MSDDILVQKFERFFIDPIGEKEILERGDKGVACSNLKRALSMASKFDLNVSNDVFDEELESAIKIFQEDNRHRVIDGRVGPGTRKLITKILLAKFDTSIFLRLSDPRGKGIYTAFISYAWKDANTVNKIYQWLQENGIRVIRDKDWFYAGTSIPDNIRYAIANSDRVICIYSANSIDREWPRVERDIAEQIENRLHHPVLIYVNLDDSRLPQHDPNRLSINVKGRHLKEVGFELLHAITGEQLPRRRYEYDPEEIL